MSQPNMENSISAISPAEYLILKDLTHAGPIKLITLVMQDLCLKRVITVQQKWTQIHDRDSRKRLRLHFQQGPEFDNYQANGTAEQFLLDLFHEVPQLRFYQIRNYFKHHFGKDNFDHFKKYYVHKDVKSKGFYRFLNFRKDTTLKLIIPLGDRLSFIDQHIDTLLLEKPKDLIAELDQLGSHILNLEDETLEKVIPLELKHFNQQISESILLNSSVFESDFEGRGISYGAAIGGSGGGGFGGSGGGGFGGGGFGGGGAGGSW